MRHFLQYMFGDGNFNRKLVSLAFPITMQNLMLALVAAGDALMLGKVSQNAMAGVSLATQIQFVQNILLGAIVVGVGVLGAQYWGKKDIVTLEKIFGLGVRLSLIISIVFFLGCFYFPEHLMKLFASDPVLIGIGTEYLKIAAWSYLLTGLSQSYLAIMKVSEHASRSAWISSGAVVMNIGFNAILIFGMFGIPAMGVKGAALATVIARVLELVWCIVSSHEKSFIVLKWKFVFNVPRLLAMDFWRYTLPLLGAFVLWGTGFTAYTAVIGHMGCDAAAANSIAAVVRDLICCICNGIAGGGGILIGNELGAGKLEEGKKCGDKITIMAFIIGGVSALVILAVIPLLSRCFELTPQAYKYAVGMFLILAVYMIGRCICTIVINGVFDSGGDTAFDVYSLAVCMWGIALPCAFLGAFYFHLPVLMVYACTCLDEVGKVPWVMHHYRKYKWVKNITR